MKIGTLLNGSVIGLTLGLQTLPSRQTRVRAEAVVELCLSSALIHARAIRVAMLGPATFIFSVAHVCRVMRKA
jgi:hypothetical protein